MGLEPTLSLGARERDSRWMVRASSSYERASRARKLADRNKLAFLTYDRQLSPTTSFDLSARYRDLRDPAAVEPSSPIITGKDTRATGVARLRLWRGEVSGRWSGWSYGEAALAEGRNRVVEAKVFPVRTPVDTWLMEYKGLRLDLEGARALESDAVRVGHRRSMSRTLSGEVQLGIAQVRFPASRPGRTRFSAVGQLNGWLAPGGTPLAYHVSIGREVVETAEIALSRALGGLGWTARCERVFEMEGEVYRDPTIMWRSSVSVADTLWAGKVFSMGGSYSRAWPTLRPSPRRRLYRAAAGVSVPWSRWLSQDVKYEFLQQVVEGNSLAVDFQRNRVSLSLRAILP